MTDVSGNVVAQYRYDAYGRKTRISGSMDSDFGYTGHYYHAASGLSLTLYRAYDPDTGRWLSRDPIGEAGGVNLYGYVGNSPISWFDELGLYSASQNPKTGAMTVNVEECEIVILYGHGNAKAPHKFKFASDTSSAGAFTGCHNKTTNDLIPDNNKIPNSPDNDGLQDGTQNWKDVESLVASSTALAKTFKGCDVVRIRLALAPSNTMGGRMADSFMGDTGWEKKFDRDVPRGKN